MGQPEAGPEFVSERLTKLRLMAARVALFDTVIDYHLAGHCTYEEAMIEFYRAAEEQGIGYGQPHNEAA